MMPSMSPFSRVKLSAIFYTIDQYSYTVQCLFLLNPVYLFIRYFRKTQHVALLQGEAHVPVRPELLHVVVPLEAAHDEFPPGSL